MRPFDFPRRTFLAGALLLAAPAFAWAEPLACAAVPMSNDEAAKISFPVVTIRAGYGTAAFPKSVKDALSARIAGAKALGSVSEVKVYKNLGDQQSATPAKVTAAYGETLAKAEGWQAVLTGGTDGFVAIGTDRFVGLFSDGKADLLIRIEPASGFPREDLPGTPTDKAKLRELASRGEVVTYRYQGKGLARAACSGRLPDAIGFDGPAPAAAVPPKA